ncbi:MAG: SDR family NAD(P)-dependent oxidoreductase, partial [Pseudonocardia sp.]
AARRVDRLDALVKRIEDAGGRALAVEADVTDEDQARAAVTATVERFGRLDTVVANAGAVATELASHNRPEIREAMAARFAGVERLAADDIARTIAFVVTSPRHMAVSEVLVRPTSQQE